MVSCFVYRHISCPCAQYWIIHIDHIKNTATGNDGVLLLFSARHPSLRFRYAYRKYAADISVHHLRQPSQVFSCHSEGHFPERCRHRNTLASNGRAIPDRGGGAGTKRAALHETTTVEECRT
jgi:hypothetical protein